MRKIFRHHPKPLHITEIIKRIKHRTGEDAPYTSVQTILGSCAKQGRYWKKVEPGIFQGLNEDVEDLPLNPRGRAKPCQPRTPKLLPSKGNSSHSSKPKKKVSKK